MPDGRFVFFTRTPAASPACMRGKEGLGLLGGLVPRRTTDSGASVAGWLPPRRGRGRAFVGEQAKDGIVVATPNIRNLLFFAPLDVGSAHACLSDCFLAKFFMNYSPFQIIRCFRYF